MADKTIDDLPAGAAPNGTEQIPGSQGGATVKFTVQQLANLAPVQDHNALTNLTAGDAHPQYLNAVRGDLRYPLLTRQVATGNGLQGGGDLSTDRTLSVKATAARGITVTVNGVEVDILGVGLLPESVDAANDFLLMYNASEGRPRYVNFTTALGAGSGFVPTSRIVASGAGLTGGGDLSVDRTLAVGAGTGITVAADTVGLDTASTRNSDHAAVIISAGNGLGGGGDITQSRTLSLDTAHARNVDHSAVSVVAGTGLSGGGDITASRTLNVNSAVVPLLALDNIFTGQRQTISHAAPTIILEDTDEAVDERKTLILLNNKVFSIRNYNNALNASKDIFTATRGINQVVLGIALGNTTDNPTVTVNGVNVRDASLLTSGTLANARVAVSNVTQHQASLSIAWSQITGTKNADQLQGLPWSDANDPNTIVARNPSGYIYGQYFNQASVNSEGGVISQFMITNGSDNFMRKASVAQVQSALGIGAASFNGATVYKSGDQTINDNTITTVTFNLEEVDDGGWHDNVTNNSRLTVPSGITRARFVGTVLFDFGAGTAYGDFYLALYKNGAIYKQVWGGATSGEGGNAQTLSLDSGPVAVAAGNYFELVVYAKAVTGTPQYVLQALNFRTQFSAERLA